MTRSAKSLNATTIAPLSGSLGPSDTEPFGPWWNVAVVPPASATRRAQRAVPTTGVSARGTPVQQNAGTVSAFAS